MNRLPPTGTPIVLVHFTPIGDGNVSIYMSASRPSITPLLMLSASMTVRCFRMDALPKPECTYFTGY